MSKPTRGRRAGRPTALLLTAGAIAAAAAITPGLVAPSGATFVDTAAAVANVQMAVLPPATPSVAAGTTTTTGATFTWAAVDTATSYDYQSRINGGGWSTTASTTGTAVTIPGSNGARVDVQVRAVNAGGTSSWSPAVTGWLIPPAPAGLAANNAGASSSSVAFSWGTIPNALRYEFVYRINGGGWSAANNNGTTTTWTGVPGANAALGVQVRAVNQAGQAGAWSAEVTGYTLNTAPNVASSGVTTTQATLNWSASGANTARYNFYFGSSGTVVGTTATSNTQGGTPGQGLPYNVCAVNPAGVQGGCNGGTVTLATPAVTLSGTYTVVDPYSGRPQFEIQLSATEVSYNLAANQSTVNWSLTQVELVGGYQSYNVQHVGAWSVNIGGCTGSGSHDTDFRNKPVGYTIGLGSGSCTFGHNADGTLTIGISASDNAGSPFGTAAVSGSYTLSKLR